MGSIKEWGRKTSRGLLSQQYGVLRGPIPLLQDGLMRFHYAVRRSFLIVAKIHSHTGDIRIYPKLIGFAKEGDSVTYTIDSAATGTYSIAFDGAFAGSAPLCVEVAGKTLAQQELKGNTLLFGSVELPKGTFPLKLIAGKPQGNVKNASVTTISFTKNER